MQNVLIIGAGQAGHSIAAKLRKEGHGGSITLLGEEPLPPYQRPPLSKKYLLGKMKQERLYLRKPSFYEDNDIDWKRNCQVRAVDMQARSVETSLGDYPFDQLVFATGSRPRQLPDALGGNLPGVFTIRSVADIDTIREQLGSMSRVAIIGGGYIGLEAAAVFRQLERDVFIIEAGERILGRVAASQTADYFRALHQQQGVSLLENTRLSRLSTEANPASAQSTLQIHLEDGEVLTADAAIVGIGAVANSELAMACGALTDDTNGGILVDQTGATNLPGVWAAGDCAAFEFSGASIRLESVQNAIDQAEAVALNLLGSETLYNPVPWFWSDQYDVKLQIAGLNTGFNRLIERTGSKPGARSHWYFKDQQLLAVDAINDAMAYMTARKMLEQGSSPDTELIANPDTDIKSLL